MKITIEIKDGLVGYQFEKSNGVVRFEDLKRQEQICILLNGFVNGYNLFSRCLKKEEE